MRLNNICDKIVIKELGELGVVVECMEGAGNNLKIGKKYTVQYFKSSSLVLKESNYAWLATRFRKVLE